jgi:hypothetical protein
MSSRIWLTLSVWPSVWGWYAELKFNLVSIASCSFFQNLNVNCVPLSYTIFLGTPCKHTILVIYNYVSFSPLYVVLIGMKWATFKNRSTITQIESKPDCVVGNPTMKSMLISSHFHWGIFNGCKSPTWLCHSALTLWQLSHSTTYSATTHFIPYHQYLLLRSWYILVLPGWIKEVESWTSCKINSLISFTSGTYMCFLYHNVPCSSTLNRGALSCLIYSLIYWILASSSWPFRISCYNVGSTFMVMTSVFDTHPRLSLSNSLQSSGNISLVANILRWDLLLRASATTLALPGW